MNLVGKIFVVLILVVSVVLMGFTMAVYATHRNWREVVLNEELVGGKSMGLAPQLRDARSRVDQLNDQLTRLQDELNKEKAAKRDALTKLEEKLNTLKDEHTGLEKQYNEKVKTERELVTAVETAQSSAKKLDADVTAERARAEKAEQERDAAFKQVVGLTDELHAEVNERERLKDLNLKLQQQVATLKNYVRMKGDNPDSEDLLGGALPPQLDGIVLAVRQEGLIEISLGADDGVRKGHLFDIFRAGAAGSSYVGRCEVTDTAAAKAVCKVDPRFLKSPVQKGDRVLTKRQ